MTKKQLSFSLDAMTKDFKMGDIRNEEMIKRDFRKAMQISVMSIISSLVVTVLAYLIDFR